MTEPARRARIRVGISGWTYPPWRGVFYPPGLRQKDELAYAAERLGSIEVNGSFYALQRPSSYRSWREQTPDDFVLSVKGGRFITHLKRLAGVETPLANFFASGVLALGPKLGPLLWQLPPTLAYDASRLEDFFALLPRTTAAAAALAARHDDKVPEDRALTEAEADQPLQHALEVRHDSFARPDAVELLQAHDIGLVVADTAGRWPFLEEVTSDFVYVRLHGAEELYASGYDPAALDTWAGRLRGWQERGRDVYCYFDNDIKVRAPFDAMALMDQVDRGSDVRLNPLVRSDLVCGAMGVSASARGSMRMVMFRLPRVMLLLAVSLLAVPGDATEPPAGSPADHVDLPASLSSIGVSALTTALDAALSGPGDATARADLAAGSRGLASGSGRSPAPAPTGMLDVPRPALQAYHHAADVLADRRPSCNLSWSLLAGVGLMESDHGRYGDAVVGVDGRSWPRILGPRLNGLGPVAAIHDSDRGRLDGDRVWDRAVGPMQFIPQTWDLVGADGDREGVRDPDDIDDAALAAGYYLCAGGGNLADAGARRSALLSYNGSEVYAFVVASYADDYAAGVWPSTPALPPGLQGVDPDKPPKPPQGLGSDVGDGTANSAGYHGGGESPGTGGPDAGTPSNGGSGNGGPGDGGPGDGGPGNGGPGNGGPGNGGPGGPGGNPGPEPPDPPDPEPVVTTKTVTLTGVPGQCSQGWCVSGTYAGALGAWSADGDYDGDCREESMGAELNGMAAADVVVQVTVEQTFVDKVLTKTETVGFSVPNPPECEGE